MTPEIYRVYFPSLIAKVRNNLTIFWAFFYLFLNGVSGRSWVQTTAQASPKWTELT
jgi:hypothetical protein